MASDQETLFKAERGKVTPDAHGTHGSPRHLQQRGLSTAEARRDPQRAWDPNHLQQGCVLERLLPPSDPRDAVPQPYALQPRDQPCPCPREDCSRSQSQHGLWAERAETATCPVTSGDVIMPR